ncbi:hypothetical protein RF11_09989 [Thelohanellus kitauei]|uniref:Uncharacterized protein n=1 Tax=Thelohanellus kitauei TaxID=669202 RepID=A0A0C2N9D7_THEKT|nr:hypothetical protein RF11_09989 [Thelohanellus kitauei]
MRSVPYGRCTPCLDCHKTDQKTTLTIGKPNNLEINYQTLPIIISDLEIYFYPLNTTALFEKCGIMTGSNFVGLRCTPKQKRLHQSRLFDLERCVEKCEHQRWENRR